MNTNIMHVGWRKASDEIVFKLQVIEIAQLQRAARMV